MSINLTPCFSLNIDVAKPVIVSQDKTFGKRQLIPIAGGTVTGRINGKILPGGVDSQIIDANGLCHLSARYAVETDEGDTFYIENNGIRRIPEQWRSQLFNDDMSFFNEIPAEAIYFKAVPTFEIYSPKLRWLSESIFICSGNRQAGQVILDIYQVD